MATQKRQTFTIMFFLKKNRIKKNGEYPLLLRLTVNGKIGDISMSISVNPIFWNQNKERCTGKDRLSQEINASIDLTKARILEIKMALQNANKPITLDTVRDIYYNRDKDSLKKAKTLCNVFQEHNDQCESLIGNGFAPGTVKKFKTSLSHLKEYIRYRDHLRPEDKKRDDIFLTEIDNEFITGFEFYLKTEANDKKVKTGKINKKGMTHNSAMKHMKNLRKIIGIALDNSWIDKNPFAKVKISYKEKNPVFLTDIELKKLLDRKFDIDRLEKVRDFFVFCCFTGLAYGDIRNLKYQYIFSDEAGNQWINKERLKTGVNSNIPLLEIPLRLIDKYKDHPGREDDFVFPIQSNQNWNAYLKEIAILCGIKKNLTVHVARHTCATTVMLSNGVSLYGVQKILGHKKITQTQHYAQMLNNQLIKEVKSVENIYKNAP